MIVCKKKLVQEVTDLLELFDTHKLEKLNYKNKNRGIFISSKNPKLERPVHSVTVDKVAAIEAPISIKNLPQHIGETKETENTNTQPQAHSNIHKITSPITGAFYKRPKPDDPPFIKEGSTVESHTTICLLEAMKMFTEVKAGVRGKVIKICKEDGDFVAEGEVLVEIQPM